MKSSITTLICLFHMMMYKDIYGYQALQDIDYWGGDMFRIEESIPIKCIDYCAMAPACMLATWFGNVCYMKNETTKPSPKSGAITFIMYPNMIDENVLTNNYTNNNPQNVSHLNDTKNNTDFVIEIPKTILPTPEINLTAKLPIPANTTVVPVTTIVNTTEVPHITATTEPKKSIASRQSTKILTAITLIMFSILVI